MSTRAIYSFTDECGTYHVYKHCDGYPSGAAEWLAAALPFAWPLPRFEADEFAAAFVTANKTYNGKPLPGDIRLLHSGEWKEIAPGDIEYRYEITFSGKSAALHVVAFTVSNNWQTNEWKERQLFSGTLAAFKAFAKKDAA